MEKTTKKPLLTRGYLCYRWREHAEARPLRLDNPLVFHSVSATNWVQKYTFSRKRNLFPLKNNEKVPIAALKKPEPCSPGFLWGLVLMDYSYS